MNAPHAFNPRCECFACSTRYSARYDALIIISNAVRRGGGYKILGSVRFHIENSLGNRIPLEWMQDFQSHHGSTVAEESTTI